MCHMCWCELTSPPAFRSPSTTLPTLARFTPPPFTTMAARSTATPTRGCAPPFPQRGHSEASLYPASAHRSQKVCPHVNMISNSGGRWCRGDCRACAVAAVPLPRAIALSALHWHPSHFTASTTSCSCVCVCACVCACVSACACSWACAQFMCVCTRVCVRVRIVCL